MQERQSYFSVSNPPFPQGTVFHTLPKSTSPRSLPWALPPPLSLKSPPFIQDFSPLVVFTCVLTQPCSRGLGTPKAAEERDGWLEMSKGWLQHVLSLSHGQECELRPLSVAYKEIEVGFGLSLRTRVTAGWSWWPHRSRIQHCRTLKAPAMEPGESPLGDMGCGKSPVLVDQVLWGEISGPAQCQRVRKMMEMALA